MGSAYVNDGVPLEVRKPSSEKYSSNLSSFPKHPVTSCKGHGIMLHAVHSRYLPIYACFTAYQPMNAQCLMMLEAFASSPVSFLFSERMTLVNNAFLNSMSSRMCCCHQTGIRRLPPQMYHIPQRMPMRLIIPSKGFGSSTGFSQVDLVGPESRSFRSVSEISSCARARFEAK